MKTPRRKKAAPPATRSWTLTITSESPGIHRIEAHNNGLKLPEIVAFLAVVNQHLIRIFAEEFKLDARAPNLRA